MKVKFIEPAESELDEAIAYYDAQRQGLGNDFLVEVLLPWIVSRRFSFARNSATTKPKTWRRAHLPARQSPVEHRGFQFSAHASR